LPCCRRRHAAHAAHPIFCRRAPPTPPICARPAPRPQELRHAKSALEAERERLLAGSSLLAGCAAEADRARAEAAHLQARARMRAAGSASWGLDTISYSLPPTTHAALTRRPP
jgi:hypothetical protein